MEENISSTFSLPPQDGVRAADRRERVFYRRVGQQRHENSPLRAQRPPAPSGGHGNFQIHQTLAVVSAVTSGVSAWLKPFFSKFAIVCITSKY